MIMLVLSEADVRELLPAVDLVSAMEQALAAFSNGEVNQPVRTALEVGPDRAFFGVMPAYIPSPMAAGAKLVTVFSGNTSRGLPTHFAAIVLVDPVTGAPAAVIGGAYLTAARTAAVSAVAVRHLARPGTAVLAILGSGVQARSHLEVLCQTRRFQEVRAWSPTPEHLARFVEDGASLVKVPLHRAGGSAQAVRGADVVVLATSSSTPVIQSEWVGPGALVVSLGAYRPGMREMDPALVARARVVVDSRAAALVEAGDIVQGIREGRWRETHIAGELGEVIRGRVPGRTAVDEVVIFKSLGMAVEDVAAAQLASARARERGTGREISL
jgi:ornithine cyclodeaminase/alanine dehydrogenase-like protein (mu-crystallin family)